MGRGRKLESLEDYQRALKNKYGIGEGASYKPWLRIQDVKSTGIRSLIYGRKSQRDHHMMSSIESEHFYLAEFSKTVLDIREQFPIFPLYFTQKVAKTLGLEHPKHPKTKEPIIMTTDQLLTIESPQGTIYHAVSVKPEQELDAPRVLEKLDIERVCWQLLGVKFSFFTGNELTRVQSHNLHWASLPFRQNPKIFAREQIEHSLSSVKVGLIFIEDLCNELISRNIASEGDALLLVRYLIAERLVEVNLSTNIPETGLLDVKFVKEYYSGANYGAS